MKIGFAGNKRTVPVGCTGLGIRIHVYACAMTYIRIYTARLNRCRETDRD